MTDTRHQIYLSILTNKFGIKSLIQNRINIDIFVNIDSFVLIFTCLSCPISRIQKTQEVILSL